MSCQVCGSYLCRCKPIDDFPSNPFIRSMKEVLAQVEAIKKEKEELKLRNQKLEAHISELEKKNFSWTQIPKEFAYKKLTDQKTEWLTEKGYYVAGYIIAKDKELGLSYGSAIRWTDANELFNFMHNIKEQQ